uniref:Transposase n=1 Tax=Romanomermis culicivorax TaxID=13658 RepID=A0A915K872_ROMCU
MKYHMPPKCVPKLSLVTRNRLVEELKFKGWNVRETARYLNERGYQCSPSSVQLRPKFKHPVSVM